MAILIWFAAILLAFLIVAALLRHCDRSGGRTAVTSKTQAKENVVSSTPLQPASRAGTLAPGCDSPHDDSPPCSNATCELTWTALDDVQLTRLLIESARRDDIG